MRKLLSVANMRKSDAHTIETQVPSAVLMYRAGVGIKLALDNYGLLDDSFIFIVCGSGNNAGDGFVLASLLAKENIPVAVCLTSDKFSEDGKYYYDICLENRIPIVKYPQYKIDVLNPNEYFDNDGGRIVIVDCLLGTGFKGIPREPVYSAINEINYVKNRFADDVVVVSVDINSGLNGDNGRTELCVVSDITVSIGDLKTGLILNQAKDYVGELVNADIGIIPVERPYYLIDSDDVKKCLPVRLNDSNKGTYGYIALLGGSFRYSGAATLATNACHGVSDELSGQDRSKDSRTSGEKTLSNDVEMLNQEALNMANNANAAMRQGAGVVMLAAPRSVSPLIIPRIVESTIFPVSDKDGEMVFVQSEIDELIKRVRVLAFGMGIGNTEESSKTLQYILENYKGVLIIDADGLNCLATMDAKVLAGSSAKRIILTPHLKEFERLSGYSVSEIRDNPIELAKSYAGDNNVIVLLKGPATVVTNGEDVYVSDRGCPGMATAGSGDVLSGILAAICGYNDKTEAETVDEKEVEHLLLTVASAAYINGLAGEMAEDEYGSISMLAGDTVSFIPMAIKEIVKNDIL